MGSGRRSEKPSQEGVKVVSRGLDNLTVIQPASCNPGHASRGDLTVGTLRGQPAGLGGHWLPLGGYEQPRCIHDDQPCHQPGGIERCPQAFTLLRPDAPAENQDDLYDGSRADRQEKDGGGR